MCGRFTLTTPVNVYSHLTDETQVAALAKLPFLERQTGTDAH